jgi:hypothetical protein
MKAGRHRHGHGKPRWRWTLLGLGAGGVIAAVALVLGIGQVAGSLACAAVLSPAGLAEATPAFPSLPPAARPARRQITSRSRKCHLPLEPGACSVGSARRGAGPGRG